MIPSQRTLYRILVQFCADVIMAKGVDLRNQNRSLMSDKGESRSYNQAKRGAPHVKLFASFDFKLQKVIVFNIGINSTGNRTIDAVEDIDHALTLWDTACETKVFVHNQCTDAGGGGTREALYRKLKACGRINDRQQVYFVATCGLHGISLTLSVPVESYLGAGGIESQNMMQLLFCAYNLSQKYKALEWKEKWLLVTGEQYKNAIPKPVLSRWEHVGSAAQHVKHNLEQWEDIAIAIAVANTKSSEVGLITNQLLQLISLPLIVAHIHLVCAYDDSFFQKHFDYLKKRDSISKLHGFNARNMPLHAYIMYRDLKHISEH